jgi:hypothetical protein
MIYGAISGATSDVQKFTGLIARLLKKRVAEPPRFLLTSQDEKYFGVYLGSTAARRAQYLTKI